MRDEVTMCSPATNTGAHEVSGTVLFEAAPECQSCAHHRAHNKSALQHDPADGSHQPETTSSDGGYSRRSFLTGSMMAAAALALAACMDESISAPDSVNSTVRVSDYSALDTVGGVALITLNGARLAIVRSGTATFEVLSRVCPHQGSTVNPTTTGFTCPKHGARFDVAGNWVGGQRTSSLRSYPAVYDAAAGTLAIG